jgi:hypothetical protein
VRGPSSIPGWLLVPAAFVVLVALRFCKSGPRKYQARDHKSVEEVMPLAHVKSMLSVMAETTWALGTRMLAGLPLLT